MNLRAKLIRLAASNPKLRGELLPLLRTKSAAPGDADRAFQKQLAIARKLLPVIGRDIQELTNSQAANPSNWGYVGSLDEVISRLEDLHDFLTSAER